MNTRSTVEDRLTVLAEDFGPNEALADAVMARVSAEPVRIPNAKPIRMWIMRSTIGLGTAACVVMVACLLLPFEQASGFDLPDQDKLQWTPLGKMTNHDVKVTPSVAPYTIQPDMSNVQSAGALGYLTDGQKKLLAGNGFLILPSASKEFYEIYYKNPAPFVTTDCVFHAYHVLLSEALKQAEVHYLAGRQAALAKAGHERMKKIVADLPAPLATAGRDALIYWAVADKLGNPDAVVSKDVAKDVAAELGRIAQAKLIGTTDPTGPKRDYTVYSPIAGYAKSDALKKYFVLNRYFTLATQPLDTDRGATTCMLIALAMGTSDDAREAYVDIARYREFLGGQGEDPTPITLLTEARRAFGGRVTHAVLADPGALKKLRRAIMAQPTPTVADQPQSVQGADPMAGYGMRMFSPGVSVRAMAYQDLAAGGGTSPRGEHMAAVLGVELPAVRSDLPALAGAKAELARRAKQPGRQDAHTLSMLTLARLAGERGKGYPSFTASDAWKIKTANTQMGAWSEVEHDLCLYLKDNTLYSCESMGQDGFHGYVEPAPRYYSALATLAGRTGQAFDQLGLFRAIAAGQVKPKDASRRWRPPVVVTREHFKALETLAIRLRDMSVKELENRLFDKTDVKFLKRLGGTLKHLNFNDSNSPEAKEPMSLVVRITRDYLDNTGGYVGVGRPLKILTIVPYGGKLHWAVGGVYSYYQFDRPLNQPLTDRAWKTMTRGALDTQPYKPWLSDKNVGLAAGECSAEAIGAWLKKHAKKVKIGNTHSHALCEQMLTRDNVMTQLNELGSTRLTPKAMEAACAAFVDGRLYSDICMALYVLIRSEPADRRAAVGAAAMREIEKEFAGSMNKLNSSNGRAWLWCTLRLLEGTKLDAKTIARIRALDQQAAGSIRRKRYVKILTEIRELAAKVLKVK